MNLIVRIGGGAAIATALLVACSSSNDAPPEDPAGSCDAIANACHPYDKISTVGHECHELGHAGVDTSCAPRKAECLAACPPREAGAHEDAGGDAAKTDAGPSDASGDANDPVCATYCQCLTDTCSSQAGYPFASSAACLSSCAGLSAAEKACWPNFCEQAKAAADKTHLCEHAWGKLGLDECP